jgi:hypothetical protein
VITTVELSHKLLIGRRYIEYAAKPDDIAGTLDVTGEVFLTPEGEQRLTKLIETDRDRVVEIVERDDLHRFHPHCTNAEICGRCGGDFDDPRHERRTWFT